MVAVPGQPLLPAKPAAGMSTGAAVAVTGAAVAGAGLSAGMIVLIVFVVGLVLVIALMAALLLPAVSAARGAARNAQCVNNLKQIAIAMHNYENTYKTLPPAFTVDAQGRPLHSWRVLLLPYLEQQNLYQQFRLDEPWNSPWNMALAEQMPPVYRCPASDSKDLGTPYVVIVGAETAFPGEKGRSIRTILDGTSNTLLVVEADGVALNWTEPRDLEFATMDFEVNLTPGNSLHSDHADHKVNVAFADASVKRLSLMADENALRAAATATGGEVLNHDAILGR